jgi:hypothetical protein
LSNILSRMCSVSKMHWLLFKKLKCWSCIPHNLYM